MRAATVLAVLLGAAWLVRAELRDTPAAAIGAAIRATPASAIAASVSLTLLSYACLAGVEGQVLRLLGRRLGRWQIAAASFAANALSIVMGFGLVSGTAVRLRIYRFAQLLPAQVTRLVVVLSAATFLSGVVTLGLSSLAALPLAADALGVSQPMATAGTVLLLTPALLWFTAFRRPRGAGLQPPGAKGRAVALAAGVGDWLFSGAALFVLASRDVAALPAFLVVFCLGSLMGSVVVVPGGLGVLEATVLALHRRSQVHETAAALVLYRAIYFLGPLFLTLAVMGVLAAARLVRHAVERRPEL